LIIFLYNHEIDKQPIFIQSDSWSNLHRTDLKNRSPHFDLEHDENAGNFAAAAPADPNLVPESQYKGEEPPEYWGPDGEFTFVPRRDCKYLQVMQRRPNFQFHI
jgi:hypothetical protein